MTKRWVQGGVLVAISLIIGVLMVFHNHHVGANDSFLPTVLGVIVVSYCFTALLLFRNYRSSGNIRMLGLATAYFFGALSATAYALSFPGFITPTGLLAANESTSVYWWRVWHVGYPTLVAAGYLVPRHWFSSKNSEADRRRHVAIACFGSAAGVSALTAGMHLFAEQLPVAIIGVTFQSLWTGGFPIIVASNVAAIAVVAYFTTHRDALERSAMLVLAAFLVDSVIGGVISARWTVGWYGSRAFALIAATTILLVALNELTRLYRKSEEDKRFLEDAALALLQEKRALESLQKRSSSVVRNAADAYMATDVNGRIIEWNTTAADLTGFSVDEVLGQDLSSTLADGEEREALQGLFDSLRESDASSHGRHVEFSVQRKDGRNVPIEATIWIDETETPRMNLFIRDITVRRQAEEQMAAALEEQRQAVARLQELDKAKSDFVSSISHELRSPLTSTLGYLEILADGGAGKLEGRQHDMVLIAERNARRLQVLIEDLLTLSRIESGSYGIRFRPFALETMLDKVVSQVEASAEQRNVTLTIDIDKSIGDCAGEVNQLTRAFTNILGNAVKFSDEGGSVEVKAQREGTDAKIVITDNGIGIPHEEQSQLFKRFFRASVAIERQHQGAGLGLTIARAIIDHHGGQVSVASTLGVGTVVTVTLPSLSAGSDLPSSAAGQVV